MKNLFKSIRDKLPYVGRLASERDNLLRERNILSEKIERLEKEKPVTSKDVGLFPPGHFYSPIPSQDDINKHQSQANEFQDQLSAIMLNPEKQLRLFNKLSKHYSSQPFTKLKKRKLRYFFENANYSYGDALILHTMIRHFKPKKIVEIGCGYSSLVTLDTNELFFNNKIQCEFVEPYPELLYSLINNKDRESINVIGKNLQDIDKSFFRKLNKNDILFIDSTHVSKYGSDVNYIIFEILPTLNQGVVIHIHDVFYPFEYPTDWLRMGIYWNEAYLLRAFLEYNQSFEIIYHNNYMVRKQEKVVKQKMPLILANPGGSIWLKKLSQ